MITAPQRGGVLVRVDGSLRFVPAAVAVCVTRPPRISSLPGAPPELLGITLHDGMIIPVLAIGPQRAEMIVCQHAGELLGLVGGSVVKTGSFSSVADDPEMVDHEGERAATFDLSTLYARIQATPHASRWGA